MSLSKSKNYAASVHQRLLNYARSSGQDFIFILRTFAMERLLFRLSRSPYVNDFVLKGAMLFKLWTGDFYRQTRDIDVLAFKSQTIDSLKAVFQDISQISFVSDGWTYLSDTVNVNEIRKEQQYGGYRITLTAMLGKAKIHLQVDCGFGDAITPEAFKETFIQNPVKQTQWQAFVRKTIFVKVEKDFGKTIDLLRIFLLPPLGSIHKLKSFKMTWPPNGPWQ